MKQKMHGYIMTIDKVEESLFTTNKYINIYCKLDSGDIMKHNHKEIILL